MAWTQHVDQLLYDGEAEQHRVTFANATVVVTTQRILVFTDGNGAAYQQVDRPNVQRVTVDTGGETRHLARAFLPGLIGSVLLAIGVGLTTIDFVPNSGVDGDDVQFTDDGTGVSVDTMSDVTNALFETVETLLTVFELGMVLLGVLSLAAATVLVGLYARSRTRTAVLRVSGDDDIEVPVRDTDIEDGLVTALKEAIRPGPPGSGLEPDATRFEDREPEALDLERAPAEVSGVDGDLPSVDGGRPTSVADRQRVDDPDPFEDPQRNDELDTLEDQRVDESTALEDRDDRERGPNRDRRDDPGGRDDRERGDEKSG